MEGLLVNSRILQISFGQCWKELSKIHFYSTIPTASPQYVVLNSYQYEELEIKKFVKCVTIEDVQTDANNISSDTVYKIKV